MNDEDWSDKKNEISKYRDLRLINIQSKHDLAIEDHANQVKAKEQAGTNGLFGIGKTYPWKF